MQEFVATVFILIFAGILIYVAWGIWRSALQHGHAKVTFARRQQGLCTHCGYDLREALSLCPECGTEMLYEVILFNDEVNAMNDVIAKIMAVIGWNEAVAKRFTRAAHIWGEASMTNVNYQLGIDLCSRLRDTGLRTALRYGTNEFPFFPIPAEQI